MGKILLDYKNNELVLSIYSNEEEKNYHGTIKGTALRKGLDSIINEPIKGIYTKDTTLIITYEDGEVYIKDYERVLNNRLLLNYKKTIKNYIEKDNKRVINSTKGRHVKRKSSLGKVVAASSLALCLLIGGISAFSEEPEKEDNNIFYYENLSYEKEYAVTTPESLTSIVIEEPQVEQTTIKEEPVVKEKEATVNYIYMNFEDRTGNETAKITRSNYTEILTNTANTYGIDPNVLIAIATQEKAVHGTEIDPNGGLGLMQIQYNVWVGSDITAYNFDTSSYETLHITDQNIRDLATNIKIAAMLFQVTLKSMDYNLPAALQGYNFGITGANRILNGYASECGVTLNEVLNNYGDTTWLNRFGKYIYSNLVLSYVPSNTKITNLKLNDNNEVEQVNYQIVNSYQKELVI